MRPKTKTDNRIFNFGKYKGDKIIDICQEDPMYVDWAVQKGLVELNVMETKVRDRYYGEAKCKQEYDFKSF